MIICKRKLQNHLNFLVLHFITGYCYKYLLFTVESNGEVKIICSLSKLLELAGDRCRFCSLHCSSISRWVVGCIVVIKCLCEMGHTFVWASSPTICNAGNSEMFKNNLVFAASILLSGNNFYKIQQLCKISSISCISPTTYFLYQRLTMCPLLSSFMNSHR